MAFLPSLPTVGTPHTEGGRLFESRSGHWENSPQVFEAEKSSRSKDITIPFPDPNRRAHSLIRIKTTAKVNTVDSFMYFNMLNSDGHWTREQNQFLGIHGTLISGASAWRETDWHQTTNAMQLNWNGVWWKCKKSTIFQSTIVLQKLGSSGATQFNFSLNGNEANSGNVFRTFGTGTINNTISDFKAIGISLDADPAFFNSHVEIY